jgi:hypothetical protein
VATTANIDPRFVLAIVLQESNGCVRAPSVAGNTRNGTTVNPGLLHSAGVATCNDNRTMSNPCPATIIRQMILDGVSAPTSGLTLVKAVNQAQGRGMGLAQVYYRAARLWNSGIGSLKDQASSGQLASLEANWPVGRRCYASDIANRLVGWTGNGMGPGSPCALDKE